MHKPRPPGRPGDLFRWCLNIGDPSIRNLIHVTVLAPGIVRWLLHFWEICGPLDYDLLLTAFGKFEIASGKLIGENAPCCGSFGCVRNCKCV
jgi:hypothetical protein